MNEARSAAARVLRASLRLAAGLGLFALVLWWIAPDWQALRARVSLVPWGLAVGLLGTSLASLVTAGRWKLLAETMGGTRLPFGAYLHGLVLTRFLGQFVPTLAMDLVGRGVALRSAGSERGIGHAATQVVVERLLDVLLPITLVLWALRARELGDGASGGALLGLVVVFFVLSTALLRPMVALALRVYLAILRRTRGVEVASMPPSPPPLAPATAAAVAGLSLARFAAVTLQFMGIAAGVGLAIPPLAMLAATAVAQIAGLLGFTPGGLGILEAGWAGGLGFVGRDELEIGLFVVAQRLGVIANFGLLSLLSWPLRVSPAPHRSAPPSPE